MRRLKIRKVFICVHTNIFLFLKLYKHVSLFVILDGATYWNVPRSERKSVWNMVMSCASRALKVDLTDVVTLFALLYLDEHDR